MERPSAASASWETLPDKMWHLRARHPPHQQCPPAAPRAGGFGHPSTALILAGVAPPLYICPQDLQKASADQPGLGHCTRGWERPGRSWWKSEITRSTLEAQSGVATPLSGCAGHPWWQAQWHSVDSSPLCEVLLPCQTPLAPLLC